MTTSRRLFFHLNRARAVLYRHADTGIERAVGASAIQVSVLFALEHNPDASLQDLGRALGLNNSAMTGLVQRMQTAGLIERRPSAKDARAAVLSITPSGQAVAQQAKPLLKQLNHTLEDGFTEQELDVVLRFLKTTAQRFERDPTLELNLTRTPGDSN